MKRTKTKVPDNQIFFREEMPINHRWILVVLGLEMLFFATVIYLQIIKGVPFGPYPITNTGIIIISILFILPMCSLLFIRVHIQIEQYGFFYKMSPLERKGHLIEAGEITKYYIRTQGNKKKSDATKGLSIELKSGKQLFFPSQNTSQLLQAMHRMTKQG